MNAFMSTNAANIRLCLDLAFTQSVDESRRWVLSAMGKHGPGMVTMLWRILGNEHDVCDAYQQTFLNLAHYQQAGKMRPKNVQAYVFRTATNAAISILRRKQRRRRYFDTMAETKPVQQDVGPADDLDAKLLQDKLRAAIAKLPDYLRDVVVLRDLAELSYEQVSNILDISAATARVYRSKAITLLAAMMAARSKVTE
jgi:RNA polymerase sigma-70 factor (ECF subfamily)